jgi:hypothetical protein
MGPLSYIRVNAPVLFFFAEIPLELDRQDHIGVYPKFPTEQRQSPI